jgi:DNA/RNA endonuclease YhcR with UshA esterase domain
MNTLLRLIVVAFLSTAWPSAPSRADTPIVSDSEAAQHIGQNVALEGVVTAVSTSRKGNTFINFGGVYPNQTFTGWIPAGTALASDASLQALQGKKVKITGTIELYRGKPEIRVLSRDQITEE